MKGTFLISVFLLVIILASQTTWSQPLVANHLCINLSQIPSQ